MHDEHDRIRRRAYELWESSGRTGDPEEHWFRAEQELKGETGEGGAASHEGSPDRSPEARKFAEQVEVATKSRNARSKQTGRGGPTGAKKKPPKGAATSKPQA